MHNNIFEQKLFNVHDAMQIPLTNSENAYKMNEGIRYTDKEGENE